MKTTKSYNVQIWVGMRIGHIDYACFISVVRGICDDFVNKEKDCITITPTEFRYVKGHENGFIIGWINYPRFPRKNKEIKNRAIRLARTLKKELGQNRISVVTPRKTYMLENND